MDGCVDVWARFEDPGVNRRLARRRADTAELVQLVVEVNEPIFVAAFGTPKHPYCDALILGQAHAHMTPYVAHFVFENLGADAKFFVGEFNGGAVLSVGRFVFFMVFQAAFLDSDRRDNLRLAFTSAAGRKSGCLTRQPCAWKRSSRDFPSLPKTSNSQSAGAKSRPSATNTRNSRHAETNCARDRARGGEALCHFAGLSLSSTRIYARR